MTKYREILRLKSLGLSQQSIADSCNVSKKTVNRVLKRAKELNISWPLDKSDTDAVLAEMFFPSAKQVRSNKRMPDYDYVHKELLRNGVSKKLLWTEYMENCHANGEEPLMYSQFSITFSRMSRNDVLPCISTGNLVSRLRSIGQEILQQSLIRIPVRSPKPIYLSA